MARYSDEFKYSIISKMMPPENRSVADIAKETGLSEATLYKWKNQAKAKGCNRQVLLDIFRQIILDMSSARIVLRFFSR